MRMGVTLPRFSSSSPALPGLLRLWRSRSSRERWMMLGLAAVGVAALLIAGLVQPLVASRAAAREAIGRHEAALARLAALPEGAAAPTADLTRPVTAVVTETAPEFGLVILRIEPEGAGARLLLEDAGFTEILAWIEALERDRGLRVIALEMERRPEPGIVSARLTLER